MRAELEIRSLDANLAGAHRMSPGRRGVMALVGISLTGSRREGRQGRAGVPWAGQRSWVSSGAADEWRATRFVHVQPRGANPQPMAMVNGPQGKLSTPGQAPCPTPSSDLFGRGALPKDAQAAVLADAGIQLLIYPGDSLRLVIEEGVRADRSHVPAFREELPHR